MLTRRCPLVSKADRPVLENGVVGYRRGHSERLLDGGDVTFAGLYGRLEIYEEPDVCGLLEIELLYLDLADTGRTSPVNPVEAVAGRIRPDRGRQWRRLQSPLWSGMAPLEVRIWKPPARQWNHTRENGYDSRPSHRRRRLEEAERITGADDHGFNSVGAASSQRHDRNPGPLGPGPEPQGPTGQRHRQIGRVVDLKPWLWQAAGV